MKLVASSTPGLVERAQAVQLLATWDVLVRSVCRELADRQGKLHAGLRANAALELLWEWKSRSNFVNGRPTITFPPECDELYAQVLAGEEVCGALMFLAGADTFSDVERDFVRIEAALTQYWDRYRCPVPAREIGLV